MMALSATPVDPRYATGIDEHPLYRVDFWTATRRAMSGASKVP